MENEIKKSRSLSSWFWGGFIAVLVTGLLLGVFAAIRGAKQWAELGLEQSAVLPPALREVIRVTLSGGESLYIDSAALPRIREESAAWLSRSREQVEGRLAKTLEQGSAAVFSGAEARVPQFADWYYSLYGEYLRLYHAAVGDLPQYLQEELETHIFGPAGTVAGIDALVEKMDGELAEGLAGVTVDFHALLRRLLQDHQVVDQGAKLQVQGEWKPAIAMGKELTPLLTLSTTDLARQGAATSAGVATAAVVIKKLGAASVAKTVTALAGKQSAGMLAALAAKLGLKTALKSGGALAGVGSGAAGGAGICAASVVGAAAAPGCALVGGAIGGIATWLLVDKAVLEADELLNRDQLEQQLREALAAQRQELEGELRGRYLAALRAGFDKLEQGMTMPDLTGKTVLKKDFVPAHAAFQE